MFSFGAAISRRRCSNQEKTNEQKLMQQNESLD